MRAQAFSTLPEAEAEGAGRIFKPLQGALQCKPAHGLAGGRVGRVPARRPGMARAAVEVRQGRPGVQGVAPAAGLAAWPAYLGPGIRTGLEHVADGLQPAAARQGQVLVLQPPAQQVALAQGRQGTQFGYRQGAGFQAAAALGIEARQLVLQGQRLGLQPGAVGDALGRGGPALGQLRQHDMTQVVAVVLHAGIGGVLDPVDAEPAGGGKDLAAGPVEQRPAHPALGKGGPARHGSESGRSAATQQRQQQGLGLIVAVLGREEPLAGAQTVGERRPAGAPRGGLGALAAPRRGIDMTDLEGHAESLAGLAAVLGPPVGRLAETMMDMERGERWQAVAQLGEQVQQHAGIHAAAVGDAQAGGGRQAAEAPEQGVRVERHRLRRPPCTRRRTSAAGSGCRAACRCWRPAADPDCAPGRCAGSRTSARGCGARRPGAPVPPRR